jgi:hypothetical protein
MEFKFIRADYGFCNEVTGYKSVVDYEREFNNLTSDVLEDLNKEVNFYFDLFIGGNLATTVIDITNKSISHIHFDVDLYIYEASTNYSRIGFQVFMKDTSYILQHLSYFAPFNIKNFDTQPSQIDTFKEYIFNCMFYIYIFCKKFKFHPMLNFFYHSDDITSMSDIKLRRNRLFGDEDNDCSVCFESTVTTTQCNHSLCNSCYAKLKVKVCPLCRSTLETNYIFTMDVIQPQHQE